MRVSQLIQLLNKFSPDAVVVMSADAEGNSYSPLAEVAYGEYIEDTKWSGDFYSLKEGEELDEDAKEAVLLVPVN